MQFFERGSKEESGIEVALQRVEWKLDLLEQAVRADSESRAVLRREIEQTLEQYPVTLQKRDPKEEEGNLQKLIEIYQEEFHRIKELLSEEDGELAEQLKRSEERIRKGMQECGLTEADTDDSAEESE